MTHLEVGLVVGGVCLIVSAVMALAWAVLNFLVGPLPATVALLLVSLITIVVIVVDWKTEKKEKKP